MCQETLKLGGATAENCWCPVPEVSLWTVGSVYPEAERIHILDRVPREPWGVNKVTGLVNHRA